MKDQPLLVKGTTIVDLVKMARKQRAEFEPVLPEETRTLIDTRILGGSWYPEQHLRNLLVAADRVLGTGDLSYCRQLGKVAAHQALEKTYRPVVVHGDVVASLRLLAVSWTFMHNTGSVTVETPSANLVEVKLESFGSPSAALCAVFAGWLEGKVEVAGGTSRVVEEQCRLRGAEACVYGVHWSVPAAPTS